MNFLAMTLIANGGRMGKGENLPDFMSNGRMAVHTFDLVIGHVILMHELRSIFRAQDLRFIVALNALPFRDMAISLDDIEMAPFAGHASCDVLPVIETPPFDLDIALRFHMARSAATDGAGDAFFIPSRASLIIVTDEAIRLVNGQMFPLDDLGVAARASKVHIPSQITQVFPMGESHILIHHILLEIFDSMTSPLEATGVANLCMRPARPLSGDEIGERYLTIHPLAFQMIPKPGLVMALCAGHLPVAGNLPGLDIDAHLMAEAAEGRAFRKFKKRPENNEKDDDTKGKKDLYPFEVGPRPFLRLSEEIDPEGPDKMIKVFERPH